MKGVQELFSLKGRVAIVTGASRGLGREAAEALAEAGASVALAARRQQWLTPTVQEFQDRGLACFAQICDITSETGAQELVAETVKRYGRVDILVNNAGISWSAPYEDMPIEMWRQVLENNVIGTHRMTRSVLPIMRAQAYGKIINVASVMGMVGVPKLVLEAAGYSASKGALIAMTRELAVNSAADGVRVNAIAPGFFTTRLTKVVVERSAERIAELTPLGRLGQDGELKGAILFLAAEASDYITGQILAIDGGMSAR